MALAGKAAVDLYYSVPWDSGCMGDLELAYAEIRHAIMERGTRGFGMVDVETRRSPVMSEGMNARNEAVTQAEMERCFAETREILLEHRALLERVADKLFERETLLYSDVKRLMGSGEWQN